MLNTQQLMNAVNPELAKNITQLQDEIKELESFINANSLAEDEKTVVQLVVKGKIKERLTVELSKFYEDRNELKRRAEAFANKENSSAYSSRHLDVLNPLIENLNKAITDAIKIEGLYQFMERAKFQQREHTAVVSSFNNLCNIEIDMAKAI